MNENLNNNLNSMEDAIYFDELPVNESEVVEDCQLPSWGEIVLKGVALGVTALAVQKGTELLIDKVVFPGAVKLVDKLKERKLRKQQQMEDAENEEIEVETEVK